MVLDNFTKITYHHKNGKNISFYRDLTGFEDLINSFEIMDKTIKHYLTEEHKIPIKQLRKYWIDNDGDEIAIANIGDLRLYVKANSHHIHCDSSDDIEDKPVILSKVVLSSAPLNNDEFTKPVHPTVSCDGCGMLPLSGFRYKCVECRNFDLCEKCESEHKHREHMMLRVPKNMSAFDIDCRFSSKGVRRSGRHHVSKTGVCPLHVDLTQKSGANAETKDGHKKHAHDHHHYTGSRKVDRRSLRNGIFAHLYDMMHDLAEGGGAMERNEEPEKAPAATATATAAAATETTEEKAKVPKENDGEKAQPKSFEDLLKEAQEIAMKVNVPKVDTEMKPQAKEPEAKPTATPEPATASAANVTAAQAPLYPFENLSQIVDPQYMKAGIQILNNFSEMFAKMLDPVENESAATSSAASTASSMASSTVETAGEKQDTPVKPVDEPMPNAAENSATTTTAKKDNDDAGITKERRSQSTDENDWQLIDDKPSTTASPQSVNESFDQVSDDGLLGAVGGVPLASAEPIVDLTMASSSSVGTQCVSQKPEEQVEAEPPVYHQDPVIQNAVVNMMAMGFSNEGAWLTQLLESVNGNIASALDIMSNAQRHSK